MGARYVESYASGEYEEKKSRFIGELFPIKSVAEAEERLSAVRKKYYDARHHCYAYVLGKQYETVKQSDDGEPSQTAGLPILQVLKGQEIHDALLTVTRYFGGTLLGTGGLVRAYGAAAKEAVRHATLLRQVEGYRVEGELDYGSVGKAKRLAECRSIREEGSEYLETVHMRWLVPEAELAAFQEELSALTRGSISLAIQKTEWYTS